MWVTLPFTTNLGEEGHNLVGKWTVSCPGTLALGAQSWRSLLSQVLDGSLEATSGNGTTRSNPTKRERLQEVIFFYLEKRVDQSGTKRKKKVLHTERRGPRPGQTYTIWSLVNVSSRLNFRESISQATAWLAVASESIRFFPLLFQWPKNKS